MALRAVVDTNVLVSGLVAEHGAPRRIFDAWLAGELTPVTSLYQIAELEYALTYLRIAKRLRLTDTELKLVLPTLVSRAELTPGQLQLPGVTRDSKDDAIIACAYEGQADYVVSGDQDILSLGQYQGVRMITPAQFSQILTGGIPPSAPQDLPGLPN